MTKEGVFIVGKLSTLGLGKATRAVYFAVEVHGEGVRDDRVTKYFEHPIRVARMLLNLGIRDDVILAAALLHDTVEDGHISLDIVREKFGDEVAHVVDLLTKREGMTPEEYFKRVAQDIRAILIKTVDRVCNVDDMTDVFFEGRLERYIGDTEKYVLPIMKQARRDYTGYTDLFIICRDYIKGILRAAKKIVELYRKIKELAGEIETLSAKNKKLMEDNRELKREIRMLKKA